MADINYNEIIDAKSAEGRFRAYLEAYCGKHGLTAQEAMGHRTVKDVKESIERQWGKRG